VAGRKAKAPYRPYRELLKGVVRLIEQARLAAVRSVNVVLTSTYWLVGQRIVEHERSGSERAAYGQALLKLLAQDLTAQLGRGFSERNIEMMRLFYLGWPNPQTVSAKSGWPLFSLPWSHYVRLRTVPDPEAREYYEHEALQGGWSVRQLDRQIASFAYRRIRRPKSVPVTNETPTAEAHLRDPFILEFLNLKDEYSETDIEDELIRSLEQFLLVTGQRLHFRCPAKTPACGNRMVSGRSAFLPPPASMPRHRRLEAREIHARRCRADEPISQLRA
jgi:hypothetical protein